MGNQVTVIIRTDGLSDIKHNAQEFVDNLHAAINRIGDRTNPEGIDIAAGCHANPARVVELHHADTTVIIVAGGSTASVLGRLYQWRWKDKIERLEDIIGCLRDQIEELRREGDTTPV